MARRTREPEPVIVRPPLTPNDAARVAGTLRHADGRPDFLRKTVDMIDRADLDGPEALERLHRFVQDWQHHARAGMLVEIGEVLAFLVSPLPGSDAFDDLIRDILKAGVGGVDDAEDIISRLKERDAWELANDFVDDLRRHYEIGRVDTLDLLRAKLIDNAPSTDEASAEQAHAAELQKALDACEDEKRKIETDRDALMAEVEELKKAHGAALRQLKGLVERVGQLHGEAAHIAADVFGATPAAAPGKAPGKAAT